MDRGDNESVRLHLSLFGGPAKGSSGGEELEADTPAIGPGENVLITLDLKQYGSKFSTFDNKYYRLDADFSGVRRDLKL